jgi:cleavage and polyadenylation specificity factor subunit 2
VSENKAFIARKGEVIDATIESHIYQVRLKDSLLSSLIFGRTRDAEVAWIDARLTYKVLSVGILLHLEQTLINADFPFCTLGGRFTRLGKWRESGPP